jgi:transposase
MAPGSPFGPGVAALVLHLHVNLPISFERLVRLMDEVFGVTLSEGAIASLLARAEAPMVAAELVASDETSARVGGKTWRQWVLVSSTAVCHIIADTRAARVVTDFRQGAVPEIWVADRYAGQNGHGLQRQVCLAHLLRDAQYAIDAGDSAFASGFKGLLKRGAAIGRRRETLKDSTLAQYHADLCHHRQKPARNWPAPSKNAEMISSSSSAAATCPIPTMAANERCDPPSSSAR